MRSWQPFLVLTRSLLLLQAWEHRYGQLPPQNKHNRGRRYVSVIPQYGSGTCLHGPTHVALIQLIGALAAIQSFFRIKMAMINITIQEDLSNALTR